MKRRPGFSHIEMVVVIGVGSLMMGLAVGLLHTLLQLDLEGRDRVRQHRMISRLAEHFRDDVHAATGWKLLEQPALQGDASQGWQFQLPGDRVVEYRAAPGELRRIERSGARLRTQESYRLPAEAVASLQATEGSPRAILRLSIAAAKKTSLGPAQRTMVVEAVAGKDYRFSQREGSTDR